MKHALHLVDLVDKSGAVVEAKKRQDIQKRTDLYHTVFTVLITPQKQIVLSKIPNRTDLPNLYAGLVGCTVATIRRHGETADEASIRSLQNELGLEDVSPKKLGESFRVLTDGNPVYMSVYCVVHTAPGDFSRTDIESLQVLTFKELTNALKKHPSAFTPSFLAVWQEYNTDLLQV
ncbi:MAG TPA: hypothetical protein VF733_03485 [Candidatus Saccharimonadales bacterium]